MYIILKNADFSAVSIGQVDIPVVISSWTENIVSRYPNYSWDDSKKEALERFHISLVTNDILDNIEYLAMPIFATTLDEATRDALGGSATVTIPTGASSRYDVSVGYGIARTGNVTSYSDAISVTQPDRTNSTPFGHDNHFMAYPLEIVPEATQYDATTSLSENPDVTEWLLASYMQCWGYGYGIYSFVVGGINNIGTNRSINTTYWCGSAGTNIHVDVNFTKLAEPAVASVYDSIIYISQAEQDYVSGAVASESKFDSTVEYTDTSEFRYGLSPVIVDGVWTARHFGFLSYGKHLTNEQSIAYQQALKRLVASLG